MVVIDWTKFGEISVDGKIYYSDMIVWWDGKVDYREKSHIVDANEYARIAARDPEIIVIGRGQHGSLKLLPEVGELADEKGIRIYIENSPKAVEMFNAFVKSGKRAAALIHTTC